MRTRFAPSPTGRLHLGHALAAQEAFGFDWPLPVRVQSRHYIDYAKVVAELLERGLAYPCQLTRSELKEGERTDPNVDARATLMEWAQSSRPDPIIARKDIGVSYHIAVTHDDHLQGITHVVRGMDLFEETPLHVLIQALMGWDTPIYHHHALMRREDGEKLSKRGLDSSIQSLRKNGLTAAQVLAMARP